MMNLELNEEQIKIYKGLKSIGNEIASFYLDGVKMFQDEEYLSKAYLLAHIAREIDGGLRDILSDGKTIHCYECDRPIHGYIDNENFEEINSNHLKSILSSLDVEDKNHQFAIFWKKTATKFSRYAHRSGAYKDSRNSNEVVRLWKDFEIVLFKLIGEYINQIKIIDRVIKKAPEKNIIATVYNITKDENNKRHFYNSLKNIEWLMPLYQNSFFDPKSIPSFEENKFWSPMTYLTYVSKEIKTESSYERNSIYLVSIIKEVCDSDECIRYRNDSRLWYFFFEILSNIPKKYLDENFKNYIHKFYDNDYNTGLIDSGLILFLKSFFVDEISKVSKGLVDEILLYIFDLTNNKKHRNTLDEGNYKYYPKVETYLLKDLSKSEGFCRDVSTIISDERIHFILEKLNIWLINDYTHGISENSLFLGETHHLRDDTVRVVYTDFLKKVLFQLNSSEPTRFHKIVKHILDEYPENKFMLRFSYYLISLNWDNTKDLFFELIMDNDVRKCFSDWDSSKELFGLMEVASERLDTKECEVINSIIQIGSQNEYFYFDYPEDFKLYWYSSLKNNPFFNPNYKSLSEKLKRDYNAVKPKEKEYVTFGSRSPYSKKALLEMPIEEVINIIRSFDPVRGFKTPCSDGLGGTLEELVTDNPNFFLDNYKDFRDIPFIYMTKIFYGLYAVSSLTNKDWNNILDFIYIYITSEGFISDDLKLKNGSLSYDKYSFIHSACRIITKGNKDSESSYNKLLVSVTDKITRKLLSYLKFEKKEQGKMGSLMDLINSNDGIILECFITVVLRKARDISNNEIDKTVKWNEFEKQFFKDILDKENHYAYMLFGKMKSNFLFIDYNWALNSIKSIKNHDIEIIKSFFGTNLVANEPSKQDYELLFEVFKLAIIQDWKFEDVGATNILERHLGVFYLFGYENIEDGTLLDILFKSHNVKRIGGLIHFYSHYVEKYVETLEVEEKHQVKERIYLLWEKCYETLMIIKSDDSEVEISGLIHLLKFVDEINDNNFNLIKNTSIISSKNWEVEVLLKQLIVLKDKGDKIKIANYIIDLIESTIYNDVYYIKHHEKPLISLITYLYSLNDKYLKHSANRICNDLALKGYYFTNDIYKKFNE